ncbi:hypothetical protein DXG03_003291 [Asterophora parasitica]|uniref:Zinc/iron permease n=1 Tax=Asterophora parasitica TaxID=117018 RepID=A0A9P7G9S7_9AGAR|nr:hypothetical protein DXG03_003291 [Asterophora parasitica]
MLIIEQLSSHSHTHSHSLVDNVALHTVKSDTNPKSPDVEFDAELGDLEREEGLDRAGYLQPEGPISAHPTETLATPGRAFPLTFGLVVHGLADGLALGASSLAKDESGGSSKLSFIVFLALIIHKAPTSLALTTSLLATSLPRAKCKKYLTIFASSTPIGAIASYLLFSFIVSEHSAAPAPGEMRPSTRVFYIALGMFVPFLLSSLLGHGH